MFFNCSDEIMNCCTKMITRGGSRNGDSVVGYPFYGLDNTFGLRGGVPNTVASVVANARSEVVSF